MTIPDDFAKLVRAFHEDAERILAEYGRRLEELQRRTPPAPDPCDDSGAD